MRMCILQKIKDISVYEKMNTRQLLKVFREMRNITYMPCVGWCDNSQKCQQNAQYNCTLLKNILKDRPHVPSKSESKAIRKAKIKRGK